MRKEPEVRKEKGLEGTQSIIDAMGERRPTYWIGGVRYIGLGAYNSLHAALYDRTEELAAANKALAEANSRVDGLVEERTEERERFESEVSDALRDTEEMGSAFVQERDAHEQTKASLSEWTSASHQLDTKRELAAARKEIEALLADMKKLGAIHNDLAVHLNETPGIPIDFEGKRKEVCDKIYGILIKYAPFFAERLVPAPAPVEYACPLCGCECTEWNNSLPVRNRYLRCNNEDCQIRSGRFSKDAERPESWIKKQGEPSE